MLLLLVTVLANGLAELGLAGTLNKEIDSQVEAIHVAAEGERPLLEPYW